ncbi:hypothetical protein [Shimia abyssi]|uniref:Uncharacterized protein n=1 Tax=Shimia abyssi TaxID=1662395 RepID=A0A2P8FFN3_9RHOB|nr:hypothetical protein [Shimia abyssi]PSL20522.1 hypothetical protein CLV88_103169 [Shimia abyssi]
MKHLAAAALIILPTLTFAAPQNNNTPADTIHPNIHSKVGRGDGTNANPNGANQNGGNIHGIANNPGKSGSNPNDDGVKGQANELETMHGGIGDYNKNAD